MFRPIPAIIWFTSERVLVFIRFMRLCNDGEISSSVVLIITTIKRLGGEKGVFCNVGIVLTWGAPQVCTIPTLQNTPPPNRGCIPRSAQYQHYRTPPSAGGAPQVSTIPTLQNTPPPPSSHVF